MSADNLFAGLICVGIVVAVGLLIILAPRSGRPKTRADSALADDNPTSEKNNPLPDGRPIIQTSGRLTDEERRMIEEDLENAG